MALADDINSLPGTITDGHTGHLGNHQTIHAAVKDHQARLGAVASRVPDGLGLTIDTSVGTVIKAGGRIIYGETGWRDITSLLSVPPNSGSLKIRRTATTTQYDFDFLDYSPGVSVTFSVGPNWGGRLNTRGEIYTSSGEVAGYYRFGYSGNALQLTFTHTLSAGGVIVLPVNNNADWPTQMIGS